MKILISGTINRPDILKMFDLMNDQDLTFVEYPSSLDGDTPKVYAPYGAVHSWREFSSADALLDKTQPDRVVLLFNSSFNQVSLRLAAKRRDIPVIHLEHGFRLRANADSQKELDAVAMRQRPLSRFLKPIELLKNNIFLGGTVMTLKGKERQQLLEYLELAYFDVPVRRTLKASAEIRRCDAYISYSQEIFEYARELDEIRPGTPVHFTGIPQFDDFRTVVSNVIPDSVLLIDHQYVNAGYFGWNMEFRRNWAKRILEVVNACGKKLFVKTHPGDDSGVWKPYVDAQMVKIVEFEHVAKHGYETVVGVLSTLMLPLAAQTHTTVLGLEIHPEPDHFVSSPLASAGILTPCFDWSEFETAMKNQTSIYENQVPQKASFTESFLFALDGLAKQRLRLSLLSPVECEK